MTVVTVPDFEANIHATHNLCPRGVGQNEEPLFIVSLLCGFSALPSDQRL